MTTARCFVAVFLWSLLASATALGKHPPIKLLDHEGRNVLDSGRSISTMRSCNHCHDTQYIAGHSYHVMLGSDERATPESVAARRPWDWSCGAFGRWNPLVYRYLSPPGDSRLDLGTAEWIATFARHVGGGPAVLGQGGTGFEQQTVGDRLDPDVFSLDAAGKPQAWDWHASGVVEMNCFLCHTPRPDNGARLKELREGRFQWASTATLASTGVAQRVQDGWAYQRAAFGADGRLDGSKLGLRGPKSENCGLCHGVVDRGEQPLMLELSLRQWSTATKGQVFSPQRISESGANLKDKERLTRSWDVHAERLLDCTSCHFSINHPAFYEPTPRSRPKHLVFEPRRLSPGQYLERPSHQFAKGHTPQGTVSRHLDGTMRRCEDCHDAAGTHDWLPYQQAHFNRLSCEACHIAQVYAPAIRQVDWTVLTPTGEPRLGWSGIAGDPSVRTAEINGFRPVLLPRAGLDGRTRLLPHNLISAWYWVQGGAVPRPVRLVDLKAALLQDGKYHPDIARVFGAGQTVLDTPEKVEVVRRRLEAVGAVSPRIEAEVQPYSLHHGVGPAKWATRECEACHTSESQLAERFTLASYVPGGVLPNVVRDSGVQFSGDLQIGGNGALNYQPSTRAASLYVLGHNRWRWVDWLGGVSLVAVVVGVVVHAGLRVRVARRGKRSENALIRVDREEEESLTS